MSTEAFASAADSDALTRSPRPATSLQLDWTGMCFAKFRGMHHDNPTEERGNDEARLHDQIREQLEHHARIDATKIGIVVRKNQVLLWGSVASESERTAAFEVAASVAGRWNVINHIHVFQT